METSNDKFKILITGGSGQIGSHLKDIYSKKGKIYFFPNSKELNLKDVKSIKGFYNDICPDLIINLGAYTNVDGAEENKEQAYLVNCEGVKNLADLASDNKIPLVHFSTDYVFGSNDGPLKEESITNPINYYGSTKELSEKIVIDKNKENIVIRLSSVFSEYGNNFIKTIAKLATEQNDIDVVFDQKITLTYALDVALFIEFLIDYYHKKGSFKDFNKNIIHFTNKNYTNWAEVAEFICYEINEIVNGKKVTAINKIKSNEWNSKAKRPIDSRLYVNYNWYKKLGIQIPNWQDRVRIVLERIYDQE